MDENAVTKIFVCSPYRPASTDPAVARSQLEANVERVRLACRMLAKLGCLPLAPHLYFTQFLKDGDTGEREEGMALGLEWLAQADEVWAFGEEITEGMSREIAAAKEMGKPVFMMPEPSQMIADLLDAIRKNSKQGNVQDETCSKG